MSSKRPLSASSLTSRGIVAARGGLVVLAVVVAIATAALVAWPRMTTALLTADLRYRVATASASLRDLQSSYVGQDFGDTATAAQQEWDAMPDTLVQQRARMRPALRSVVAPGRYVGRAEGTPQGIPASGPPKPQSSTFYNLSIEGNPLLESDAVLDAGSWPTPVSEVSPTTPIQVVMATDAAKTMRWKIGQKQTLSFTDGPKQLVVLVGTVRPRDAGSDYWQLDRARSHTGITHNADLSKTFLHGVIWVDSGSWATVAPLIGDDAINTWFPVTSTGFSMSNLAPVGTQLQNYLATSYGRTGQSVSTQLPTVLQDFTARAGPANTLLTIFATGPLGAALAVLLLGIRLLIDRRMPALALLRARGASGLRLRAGIALETAVASVPAAVVGGVLGIVFSPGGLGVSSALLILLSVIVPPALAAILIGPRLGEVRLSRRPTGRSRIWILEVLVIALAALSLVVIREQGLTPSAAAFTPDPLLVISPLLVAFATCVIVLRAYPYPLRWLGRVFRRGNGTVGYLGWATSMRARSGGLWPLFAVVTGVSIAVFSLAFLTTEREGVESAAVTQVGADISVTAPGIPAAEAKRLRDVPGVAHSALIRDVGNVALSNGANYVELYLADPAELARVVADAPSGRRPFAQLFGKSSGPPVSIAGGFDEIAPKTVTLKAGRDTGFTVRLTKLSDPPGDFIHDPEWMIIDGTAIPASAHFSGPISTVLLSLDAGADARAVTRRLVSIAGGDAEVTAAATQAASLRAAPLVSGVEGITLAALLLAALMCVAALVLTLVMRTSERVRLLATLRTLGFSRRQSTSLIGWELGPISVAGIVAGTVVGVVLPIVLLASVNLAGFTGGTVRPALVIDPLLVAATALGFALATVIATIIAMVFARRAAPTSVLRERGEE